MKVRRIIAVVSVLALVLSVGSDAWAKKRKDAEPTNIDRINLGKVMLQDRHYDRALAQLEGVKLDNEKDPVDLAEYWFLVGISLNGLSNWKNAAEAFSKAKANGNLDPRATLLEANAHLQLKAPSEALAALATAPPEARQIGEFYLLESRAHYDSGNKFEAFGALDRGYQAVPESDNIARKRVLLLVDLGLYQTAVDEAQVFFERDSTRPEDYAALATALIEANEKQRATLLLEQAALLYPENVDIRKRLGFAYYEQGRPLSAGDVLYTLALIDGEHARSAAELYVQAKRYPRAVRMNAKVEEQSAKVKQRLIILLDENHFEAATGLDRRIERLGLLEDENVVYALAYAHYRSGNFARMEQLLSLITDASLFRKAIELRRSAEECRQSIWKCD